MGNCRAIHREMTSDGWDRHGSSRDGEAEPSTRCSCEWGRLALVVGQGRGRGGGTSTLAWPRE